MGSQKHYCRKMTANFETILLYLFSKFICTRVSRFLAFFQLLNVFWISDIDTPNCSASSLTVSQGFASTISFSTPLSRAECRSQSLSSWRFLSPRRSKILQTIDLWCILALLFSYILISLVRISIQIVLVL